MPLVHGRETRRGVGDGYDAIINALLIFVDESEHLADRRVNETRQLPFYPGIVVGVESALRPHTVAIHENAQGIAAGPRETRILGQEGSVDGTAIDAYGLGVIEQHAKLEVAGGGVQLGVANHPGASW
jgi:hypothetical protein